MLTRMDRILRKALDGGYGVAAPNIIDIETTKAAVEAAAESNAPIILDVGQAFDPYMLADVVRYYTDKYPDVPVALNLDHGTTLQAVMHAIRAGFTSVMVDKSTLGFDANASFTTMVCEIAHAVDVSVEAELGHVGQGVRYVEDRDAGLTPVEEASRFVAATGVDCLAVAVGNAHGRYVGTPQMDFERLAAIRDAAAIPLVLHGGSGTGDDNLQRAVSLGITKVNLYTDLSVAGCARLSNYLATHEHPIIRDAFMSAVEGYKDMLKHYIRVLGSENRI